MSVTIHMNMDSSIYNGYYVYILLDPRKPKITELKDFVLNCEPFYVGKGSGRRWARHFQESEFKRPYNYHKNNITKAILKAGFAVEDCIFMAKTQMSEKESLDYEMELIKSIGCTYLKNGPLSNKNEGGTSPKTYSFTWEERFGVEKAAKMKEDLIKRNKEDNPYFKRTGPHIPYKCSQEEIEKMRERASKKVISISRENKIQHFPSAKETSKQLNIPAGSVSKCCQRQAFTVGDYVCFYEEDVKDQSEQSLIEDSKERFAKRDRFKIKVQKVCLLTNKTLAVYSSVAEAAAVFFGSCKRAGDISAAIKFKRKCGGFFWRKE